MKLDKKPKSTNQPKKKLLRSNPTPTMIEVDFTANDDKYTPKSIDGSLYDLVSHIPEVPGSYGSYQKVSLNYRTTLIIGCGIKAVIPKGWKMCAAAKSSYARRGLVCTVDPECCGEIQIITINNGREIIEINDGDNFAQCWIEPVHNIQWNKK